MQFTAWIEQNTGRKMIVTDRVRNGNRLLRKRNIEQKKDCVFTSCITISGIAEEFLNAWSACIGEEGVTLLEPEACVYLLDELLEKAREEYTFVPEECHCVKTTETILKSLNQIRMNEPKKGFLDSEDSKITELKKLIFVYEQKLEKENYCDQALLIKKAVTILEQIKDKEELFFYLPWITSCNIGYLEDLELTALEQHFFDRLLGLSGHEAEKLEYYSDCKNNKVNYRFFSAYGSFNEVRYVVEDILEKNRRYDEVNVFYTSPEYENIIKSAFESRGIPYQFLTGERTSENPLMLIFRALLEFAKEDFLYERLNIVMENPLISFWRIQKENTDALENPLTCYNHFLRKGIGWGKQRYAECVERVSQNEYEKIRYQYFLEFLNDLLFVFEEETSCGVLYGKLLDFVSKYTNHQNKKRNQMLSVLREQIPVFDQMAVQENQQKCILMIEDCVRTLKVSSVEDEAGSVHVMRVQNLEVLERPYQYVIGLSAKQFQGDTIESPVLSDEELKLYLNGKITLAADASRKVRENLEHSFATLSQGEIVMGYSSYDTVSLKESSPSVFYLNYSDGYEIEKKNYSLLKHPVKILKDEVTAAAETDEEQVKEERIRKMSPSALQTMLNCPLAYYYQYEKLIANREFQEKKESVWLSPANKGNLFHQTMENYCNALLLEKEVTEFKPDKEEFERIYKDIVEKILEVQPYVSKVVYDREVEENKGLLWDYLQKFYEELEKDYAVGKKWRILGCELKFENVPFFVEDPDENAAEKKEPYVILFHGSIDRLDGYLGEDGMLYLRVVDYKTGNKTNIKAGVTENKQIQHVVYALAAQMQMFGDKKKEELERFFGGTIGGCAVDSAQYVFPHEKQQILDVTKELNENFYHGEGQYDMPKSVREIAWRVLDESDYNIKEPACTYCNYKRQCRRQLGAEI